MATRVASLYADVDVNTGSAQGGLRDFRGELERTQNSAQKSNMRFTEMASKFSTLQSAAGLTVGTFKQVWGIFEQGASLELAKSRFDNLAASIGTTSDALLGDFSQATGGMMSNAEQISSASQIISLGLADNQEDVVALGSLVSQLGWDMQQVILTFANNSKARLDALGLSVTDVEERMKDFEAQGYDTDKAFDLAVIEAGQAKLELLGSAADTGAGAMERLSVRATDAKNALLELVAVRTEGVWAGVANTLDSVEAAQADLTEAFDKGLITEEQYMNGMIDVSQLLRDRRGELANARAALEEYHGTVEVADSKLGQYIIVQEEASDAVDAYGWSLDGVRSNYEGLYQTEFENFSDDLREQKSAALEAASAIREEQEEIRALAEATEQARQAEFADTFTAALDEQNIAFGDWVTTATAVGGLSEEQQENFDELSKKAERLRDNIRSLQGGVAGLGLSEDELNGKLAENYEQLGLVEAAMAPLSDSVVTYTDVQQRWVVDAEAMNEALFQQITASTDNEVAITAAGIALGLYDEAQIEAALNAAIINEKINALAEAFVNGEITAGQMKGMMDDIVANSPYTSEVDVITADAISSIDKIRSKLDALDGLTVTSKVNIVESRTSAPSGDATGGGGGGRRGDDNQASGTGGNWLTVPPGYPGDSFMVGLTTGEQYSVKPTAQSGGGSGQQMNLTININGGGSNNPAMFGRKIASTVVSELGRRTQ